MLIDYRMGKGWGRVRARGCDRGHLRNVLTSLRHSSRRPWSCVLVGLNGAGEANEASPKFSLSLFHAVSLPATRATDTHNLPPPTRLGMEEVEDDEVLAEPMINKALADTLRATKTLQYALILPFIYVHIQIALHPHYLLCNGRILNRTG